MKIIIFESNADRALHLTRELERAGHQVVARTTSFPKLRWFLEHARAQAIAMEDGGGPENGPCQCPVGTSSCAPLTYSLLHQQGHRVCLAPQVWEAALRLCLPSQPLDELLEDAEEAFRRHSLRVPMGLGCLPPCWLAALPRLVARSAREFPMQRLPLALNSLSAKYGLLEVEFLDEHLLGPLRPDRRSLRSQLRQQWNLGLYPALFRPLTPRHLRRLRLERPDLHFYLDLHQPAAAAA